MEDKKSDDSTLLLLVAGGFVVAGFFGIGPCAGLSPEEDEPPEPPPIVMGGGGYPSYPGDLDCADVGGPVIVGIRDPYGLDRDGDGIGCELGG